MEVLENILRKICISSVSGEGLNRLALPNDRVLFGYTYYTYYTIIIVLNKNTVNSLKLIRSIHCSTVFRNY